MPTKALLQKWAKATTLVATVTPRTILRLRAMSHPTPILPTPPRPTTPTRLMSLRRPQPTPPTAQTPTQPASSTPPTSTVRTSSSLPRRHSLSRRLRRRHLPRPCVRRKNRASKSPRQIIRILFRATTNASRTSPLHGRRPMMPRTTARRVFPLCPKPTSSRSR